MRRWGAGIALALALGFGATQSVASPRDDAAVGGARACSTGQCSRQCKAAGYDGGVCAGGLCSCYIGPVP